MGSTNSTAKTECTTDYNSEDVRDSTDASILKNAKGAAETAGAVNSNKIKAAIESTETIVGSDETIEAVRSEELLEGALRQGEQSFFPKLSEDVEVLVDTVNHDKTQDYIQNKFDKFNRNTLPSCRKQVNEIIEEAESLCSENDSQRQGIVRKCEEMERMCDGIKYCTTVYDILKDLKKLLKKMSDELDQEMAGCISQQTGNVPGMACPWRSNYYQQACTCPVECYFHQGQHCCSYCYRRLGYDDCVIDDINRRLPDDIRQRINNIRGIADRIIRELTETVHPSAVVRRIYNALITSLFGELDFLNKSLDESDRANKFIQYIEEGDSKPVNKADRDAAFEEYVRQWRENNQPSYRSVVGRNIENEIGEIKLEYENAVDETELIKRRIVGDLRNVIDKAITDIGAVFYSVKTTTLDDIKCEFEPLRDKLLWTVNTPLLYVGSIVSTDASRAVGGWFDRISQRLVQYLTEPESSQSDSSLRNLLIRENLEKDIHYFHECLSNWSIKTKSVLNILKCQIEKLQPVQINQIRTSLQDLLNILPEKSFYLPKKLIMKETERMSKFFYALVLNDPTLLREHQELLDSMIQDAARTDEGQQPPNCKSSLMPLISFGQLPLAGGSTSRMIRLKFVLDISYSHTKAQEVLQEVCKMFENVRKSEIVKEYGVKMINLDIQILDNIPQTICSLVSKLSDLHIRAVLVGEYGMGIGGSSSSESSHGASGLRPVMNPQYNRIYSVKAVDEAANFIPRYFPGFRNKGGEPHFCPNGWRRYGVDVGVPGSEFEKKYGDWPVAYHGTKGHIATKILLRGMKANGPTIDIRCPNLKDDEGAVFLSPSIEYCGHPYYANVWKVKNKYVQMVLQVRVDRKRIFKRIEGTIAGSKKKDRAFDRYLEDGKAKFKDNSQLEWIVKWPPFTPMNAMDGLVVYGIMLRVTDEHPGRLPQNVWWLESKPQEKPMWNFF